MHFEAFLRLLTLLYPRHRDATSLYVIVQRKHGQTADFFMARALKPVDFPYPEWQEKPVGYTIESEVP